LLFIFVLHVDLKKSNKRWLKREEQLNSRI